MSLARFPRRSCQDGGLARDTDVAAPMGSEVLAAILSGDYSAWKGSIAHPVPDDTCETTLSEQPMLQPEGSYAEFWPGTDALTLVSTL